MTKFLQMMRAEVWRRKWFWLTGLLLLLLLLAAVIVLTQGSVISPIAASSIARLAP